MTDAGYVELRCRSAFSFLQGASLPEDLVARAAALGYPALALTDAGGLPGASRFHEAAKAAGLRPILGAEVVVAGHPLLLLCESQAGYRHLCRLLTDANLAGPRSWDDLGALAGGLTALTGGAEGAMGGALARGDGEAAAEALDRLVRIFGPAHLAAELQIHYEEAEDRRNAAVVALARRHHVPLVLTNDVRYATSDRADLFDVLTCVRGGFTLDQAGTRLLRNAERHLKPAAEMAALVPDLPEAIETAAEIAARCTFTLDRLGYRFPTFPVPPGETQAGFLRAVVAEAAPSRFHPLTPRAQAQLDRELSLIERLDLAGYFLIVWDLICFCRSRGYLVQGRGSAANSAVCYALGITACDPLQYDLLFERFLSEERGEWPDIDLDLPAGPHREEVIQYMYRKYGKRGAALVANVVSYRGRSALRDLGKALGFPPEVLGRAAPHLDRVSDAAGAELDAALRPAGLHPGEPRVQQLLRLCGQVQDLPRHLGQHPGGMVLCAGRLDEVVPLQKATMPGRVILQWDKDDVAARGLIKIDLLGLGMMRALEEAVRLCPAQDGVPFDLSALPPDDPDTYAVLREADSMGMFQVESRAQMATLPRVRPRRFYDLVVQVALIRPGPILGKLVHPYLRRRAGREPVTYPHPALRPALERTLGIPLFQEQIMRVAMVAAGFSGGQADALRRAMGKKRSTAAMAALRDQLTQGMARQGITGEIAEAILQGITSFAEYGFPESHAISFALLAYASAYLKVHHPAVFYVSLFNAQPMGFYQPATLVKDAQRHGGQVLPICVNRSAWDCTVQDETRPAHRWRVGLRFVRGLRAEAGQALVTARGDRPFSTLADLRRRCPALRAEELSTLAEIGALAALEGNPGRRDALWQVAGLPAPGSLLLGARDDDVSPLPEMTAAEAVAADYRGSGLTVGPHPLSFQREDLRQRGVVPAAELVHRRHRDAVTVAGVVIVRQRPQTANGVLFVSLEDETGVGNLVVLPEVVAAQRAVLCGAAALLVEGTVERQDWVVHIKVKRAEALPLRSGRTGPSHDFR